MPTVADPAILRRLETRLLALRPDSPRRWGSFSPGEMLCHLGDATARVLRRPGGNPGTRRRLRKWVALRSPLRWPHGVPTLPQINPRAEGTQPTEFEADRRRAIEGLRAVATAPVEALPAAHAFFGTMDAGDWQRWAYRHTDHHLRQFGV